MTLRLLCLVLAAATLGGCHRVQDAGPLSEPLEDGVLHQAQLSDPPIATSDGRLAQLEAKRGLYRGGPTPTPTPAPTPLATPTPLPTPLATPAPVLASDDDDSSSTSVVGADDDDSAGAALSVVSPDEGATERPLETGSAEAVGAEDAVASESGSGAEAAASGATEPEDATAAGTTEGEATAALGAPGLASESPAEPAEDAALAAAIAAGEEAAALHEAEAAAREAAASDPSEAASDVPASDQAALDALASLRPTQICPPAQPALLTTPTSQLELVRTWVEGEHLKAELRAPDGSLYQVASGDRVGADGGKVVELSRRELVVGEIGFSLDGRAAIFARVLRLPN